MFRFLVNSSLHNRLLVLALALVMVIYGGMTLQRMPVDVFPDLNRPTVTLMTEAGGMAPEEVEQLVTFPLESGLNGLPGVVGVRSVSAVGLSVVYVSFDWQVDIYRARQMVAERLNSVRERLPAGVVPSMGPVSSIMGEVMLIALPIEPGKASAMQVREYADWVLRPRLLAIPGVAQVIPIGGEVREFRVQPNTARMAELGITLEQIEAVLTQFAANSSGGFRELNGREYLIRHLGRTTRLADLQGLAVAVRSGQPILLQQVAEVAFAAATKRGDGGFNGQPAVILGVQKQPDADTVKLTRQLEAALTALAKQRPAGMAEPQITFRQANFIEASIGNLQHKLLAAGVLVAVVLFLFLHNLRTTLISLTAIPLSILTAALVFHYFGLSINTMTLGGLAIAIGELVDDAVVDIENVLRRLKLARQSGDQRHPLLIIAAATLEVRSAVVYATLIIVLVFVPLFALPGMEGRLFVPLGIAYIVSILASLLVAVTVTPVLAYFLLPRMAGLAHGDAPLARWLKSHYQQALQALLQHPRTVILSALCAVLLAGASLSLFPRTFLPPFNEGSLVIGITLNPGTTLAESSRIAAQAERLVRQVPEVEHVGRRSGRAELDEHAEGVHVSELDVKLRSGRRLAEIQTELRQRLAVLPVAVNIGQPISHRLDHLLSGVRAQIALKIFGDDLDTLRSQAASLKQRLENIPGLTDLQVEKQTLIPQIKVHIDYARAAQYGASPSQMLDSLQTLVDGKRVTQVIEGGRRFALVLRLPEGERSIIGLQRLLIDTPTGRVPLSLLATIEEGDGPNQIGREDGRRRIVISANAGNRPLSAVVGDIRQVIADSHLPEGYFITLGGQFQAQEEASRLIGLLSLVSAALIALVLYSRYRSLVLTALIMANIPLALVGAVLGLAISGQPLSVGALIGFITLAGIATRNGILKVSHYINLCLFEGEQWGQAMIVRGSLERLTPVLMTALVAAFALAPLLFEAEMPGTEILHPLAVVIFSGLISSTLLDSFVTPVAFWLFGGKPLQKVLTEQNGEAF